MMGETVKLTEKRDFTMTALMNYLNKEYGGKRSGAEFNVRDIQQYTIKGRVPKAYGGKKIKVIENKIIGIKILRLQ